MVDFDFDKILYRKPHLKRKVVEVDKIIGIDTETLIDGSPFMFGLSTGECWGPKEWPSICFTETYVGANFVVWNLKFDSGSFLQHVPCEGDYDGWVPKWVIEGKQVPFYESPRHELWKEGETTYRGVHYKYIPHKHLRMSVLKVNLKDFVRYYGYDPYLNTDKHPVKVQFWDVQQFYEMGLEKASAKYLDKHKLDMPTKKFTKVYVKKNWRKLSAYCVMDAKLTRDLAIYLKGKVHDFGMDFVAPYSSASLSFNYFKTHGRIITVWRFWKLYNELIRAACSAYEGGKFEVTARGSFDGYEYDIVSAYSSEITNLVDISLGSVVHSKDYRAEAVYGFCYVRIYNEYGQPLPCGKMVHGVRIYGLGVLERWVTKQEYEYLVEQDIGVKLLDGWWLMVSHIRHPYRRTMRHLFELKDQHKGKDAMLYHLSKRMANAFYGKSVQLIRDPDGNLVAGMGWNPIYGAVITANVRLRVTRLQQQLGQYCLAVHTDSVITTKTLPREMLSEDLGGLELKAKGNGLLLMSGMYDMADKTACRGVKLKSGDRWRALLEASPKRSTLQYPQIRVTTWIEALSHGWTDRVNVFEPYTKVIDLNCDVKRTWLRRVKCRDLLTGIEQSVPKVMI